MACLFMASCAVYYHIIAIVVTSSADCTFSSLLTWCYTIMEFMLMQAANGARLLVQTVLALWLFGIEFRSDCNGSPII